MASSTASPSEDAQVSEDTSGAVFRKRKVAVALGLLIVVATAIIFAGFALHAFNLGRPPSNQLISIIITHEGYNGSVGHYPSPWPVINLVKGDNVTFRLVNSDPTGEPHGFAIVHYLNAGVTLAAGQSRDVTFTANQPGKFTVYCNIYCTIHNYMQNGQLNVV